MTQTAHPLQTHWDAALKAKASDIRLIALDVDGIMSDGRLYFSASGDELKAFNILDGLGLKQLMQAGITVAVITGRRSPLNLAPEQIAYMGDDLPDLPALRFAGLGITVPNGYWLVQQHADYCTRSPGGQGAVREACDLLLWAQGHLDNTLAPYLDEPA